MPIPKLITPRSTTSTLSRLCWIAAGALLAGLFFACATGDVTEDDPVNVTDSGTGNDGAVKDTGKDGGEAGSGACTGAAPANTCAAPIDVGTVAVGKTETRDLTLAPANRDLWFKITFGGLGDRAAHPHVKLAADAAAFLQMEIVKGCAAGQQLNCGAEDAMSAVTTEFESSYAAGAGVGPDDAGDPTDDADLSEAGVFTPLPLGPGGVLYVRVFRKLGAPGPCAPLTLTVSN